MREPQRFVTPIALCVAVLAAALSGCTIPRTWQYPPNPPGKLLDLKAAKSLPLTVAVQPFRDLRGEKAQEESWRVAIPFYPYAVDSFDRPETVKAVEGVPLIKMNPSQDFARAIADEIRNAGMFSSVSLVDSSGAGKADLVLSGTIRSTGWKRTRTTYMLGPVGVILWLLGAPMGENVNTVELDVQLAPAGAPARSAWQYSMQFKDEHLVGIYYGREESIENYSTAIQETLKPALADLMKIVAERPDILQTTK